MTDKTLEFLCAFILTLTWCTFLFLVVKVPGLAENRPSVMKGDALYVTAPGETREWQGYVHRVERDEVRSVGGVYMVGMHFMARQFLVLVKCMNGKAMCTRWKGMR